MRATFKIVLMVLGGLLFMPVQAQPYDDLLVPIQVIVNVDSGLITLNRQQVMGLFLGRSRSFPSGADAKPYDYEIGSELRKMFFEQLTGKSIADIDAYWARLRYSGRTSPPRIINDLNKTIEVVRHDKNAIAYIRQKNPLELAKLGIVVVHFIHENAEAL